MLSKKLGAKNAMNLRLRAFEERACWRAAIFPRPKEMLDPK
jgi:hypothetical protein